MKLANRSHRWVLAVAVVTCLVTPMLVACGGKAPDAPKDSPEMLQKRKEKKDQ